MKLSRLMGKLTAEYLAHGDMDMEIVVVSDLDVGGKSRSTSVLKDADVVRFNKTEACVLKLIVGRQRR